MRLKTIRRKALECLRRGEYQSAKHLQDIVNMHYAPYQNSTLLREEKLTRLYEEYLALEKEYQALRKRIKVVLNEYENVFNSKIPKRAMKEGNYCIGCGVRLHTPYNKFNNQLCLSCKDTYAKSFN